MRRRFSSILLLGLIPLVSAVTAGAAENQAAEISFPAIWNQIKRNAPSERELDAELQASRIEKERSLRQDLPRVYLDLRAFSTNEPALSFFSILNQREIHSSDFEPDSLNNPGNNLFEKGILGLDWTFYDGGAKSSHVASQGKRVEARFQDQRYGTIILYSESASLYESAVLLEEELADMNRLSESASRMIGKYHIGVKNNPVGYSGLLGLKSLKNRIDEAVVGLSDELNSVKNRLSEKAAGLPSGWEPVRGGPKEPLFEFVRQFLNRGDGPDNKTPSAGIQALEAEAEAANFAIDGEKAGDRPKIGLFTEGSVYNGNRDLGSAYVFGAYLTWDLFSADRYRKSDQAQAAAFSLKSKSENAQLTEKIERENLSGSILALEKRIDLMNERSRWLNEELETSRKLFLSGSVTIVQLVDTMGQIAGLTMSRYDAERDYLNAAARRFVLTANEIPGVDGIAGHD